MPNTFTLSQIPNMNNRIPTSRYQRMIIYKLHSKPLHGKINLSQRSGDFSYTPDTVCEAAESASLTKARLSTRALTTGKDVAVLSINADSQHVNPNETATLNVSSSFDLQRFSNFRWLGAESTSTSAQFSREFPGIYEVCVVGEIDQGESTSTACIAIQVLGTREAPPACEEKDQFSDQFLYTVSDGSALSNAGTVTLLVGQANTRPIAENLMVTTEEDQAIESVLQGSDADRNALTYTIVDAAEHGQINITNSATGEFRYTPENNYNGTDRFTYKVNDGAKDSNTATVTLTINPINDPPVAHQAGPVSVQEDQSQEIQLSADDIDSTGLTYSLVNNGRLGSAEVINAQSGVIRYQPLVNVNGRDELQFKVNDGELDSTSARIIIDITPVDDGVIAVDDSFSSDEDQSYQGELNFIDVDQDTLTFSIISQTSLGQIALTDSNRGTFTYTPQLNANGNDQFQFQVSDGRNTSNTATVNITLNPVNDAPEAPSLLSFDTLEDQVLNATLSATASEFVFKTRRSRGLSIDDQSGS